MFGKRVPNCVKREGKFHVSDAFGEIVFESATRETALNFLRQNYLELKACAIHDNLAESNHAGLRAWFGKGKKVVLEEVAGIVTTPRVKELASAETGKPVKANPNVCPKPERRH